MEPIAIVGEAVAGHSATLRKQLADLSTDLQRNTFDIGELALEMQEHGYFHEWGYNSLAEYSEQELGIKHRKLQYLARIYKVCRACGVIRKDYEQAGVTKLRMITSLDPDTTYFNQDSKVHESMIDYIVELIAEAPELSTKEIQERVEHLKGMDGENAMLLRSYKVTRSAYENTVQPALEAMRKILGSKGRDGTGAAVEYSDGACLEFICREFLNDPSNFMEEQDESHVQIEVQEETNVRTAGASPSMAESEDPQDTLQGSPQSLVISTEDEHPGTL